MLISFTLKCLPITCSVQGHEAVVLISFSGGTVVHHDMASSLCVLNMFHLFLDGTSNTLYSHRISVILTQWTDPRAPHDTKITVAGSHNKLRHKHVLWSLNQ